MAVFALLERIVLYLWAIITGIRWSPALTDSLRTRIDNTARISPSIDIPRGKKTKGELKVVGEDRNFLMCAQKRKLVDKPSADSLIEGQGPSRGVYIPVNKLIGEVASSHCERLQDLLLDDEVGRIAIHGMQGIGKTILMMHLHNYALKWIERFDYVFWVTLSHQLSIKQVQDAVAAAVKCDLSNVDDLIIRAQKLFDTLAGLGHFVLFLDNVPESSFSLQEVGITIPTEGSTSKLVITTSSPSVCGLLDCFKKLKLGPLPVKEAWNLFMHEAGVDIGPFSSLHDIAVSIVNECCGVPRRIVEIARHLRGNDDVHEWRNALFEMTNVVINEG